MKSWIWLRIAAVITLLYFAGHTMGMPWTPATGPQEVAVLDAMKASRFLAMGASRTYWDFYFGFGVAISAHLLVQAVALWQLANVERRIAGATRPICAAFCIAFVVNAVVVWKYFFAVPLVMAIAVAICLALAYQTSSPDEVK